MLPLLDLNAQHESIREELNRAIAKVIGHGQFVQGPEVAQFEDAYAAFCGATHCIGTANGTAAIEVTLRGAGIGRGDEIITTPFTFIATVEPILQAGAKPVFVDVERETGLMSADAAAEAITPRTAALMPVHLYGQPVDVDAFRALAERHKLMLIEDAAQAHGARWRNVSVGSGGDAATFSFFPGKNLGAMGDAGCITTNNDELAVRMRKIRDHGRAEKYRHDVVGTNARLDTLQAAVLAAKLPHLERWNDARRRHASAYDEAFRELEDITPLLTADGADPVYHQYVITVPDRDDAREHLIRHGVGAAVHYPVPLHQQPALEDYAGAVFPAAEWLAANVLSLPMFPELTNSQIDEVVSVLSSFVTSRVSARS
jgi:dTDP-4-amino-4,6-dideoxygalactose transaminase